MIVKLEDLKTAKICHPGARLWWKRHGLNWADFVESGIEAERLEATGDGIVARVVEAARVRIEGEA
jgi:hypothetical protein